jgi:hypothetical protein
MSITRLLAKGWVLVCLFAGAHALRLAILGGGDPFAVVLQVTISVFLFAAMGLLFVGGYGASAGTQRFHNLRLKSFKLSNLRPSFNGAVFAAFVLLSFLNQIFYAPQHTSGSIERAFEAAIYFAVPGHHALGDALGRCNLDGGAAFGSAFAWLFAVIFVASAVSRLKIAAGLIRIERTLHPETLSPTTVASVLAVAAIFGIQCFFVGSVYSFLPCGVLGGIGGVVLIGLAPLLLAYLIFAALAALLASGSQA